MKLTKTLHILFFVSAVLFFALIISSVYHPILLINHFDKITFTGVFMLTVGVAQLFLYKSKVVFILALAVLFLVFLPLILFGTVIIDSSLMEESWPLLLSLIYFQIAIGKLALLNFFSPSKTKNNWEITSAIMVLTTLIAGILITLLKVSDPFIHDLFLYLILFSSILFIGNLFFSRPSS